MTERAAIRARESLLNGPSARVMREEGLEIIPGTNATVGNRPPGWESMSDAEYQCDYNERVLTTVNESATRLLAERPAMMTDMQSRIQDFLIESGWRGDTRVEQPLLVPGAALRLPTSG